MRTNRGDGNGLPWRLSDLVVSLVLVFLMVALYAWSERMDEKADRDLERLAVQERARISTQEKLPAKVREAYSVDLAADDARCFTRRVDGRTVCYRGDPR